MKRYFVLTYFVLFGFACLTAMGQVVGLPRFELSTSPEIVAAGEPFQFSVKIIYNSSITIQPRTQPVDLSPFVIQDASKQEHMDYESGPPAQVDPKTHPGLMYDEYLFTLLIDEPGVQQIPSIQFTYGLANGQTASVSTEPYPIGIEGAIGGDDELRDIKPPMEMEGKSYLWVVFLVLAVLIAALLLAYSLWKRFKKEPEVAPAPLVPPHIKALEALKAVREDETLFRERRLEELTIRVTEIVRVYLYDQFGILAMDYTSEEIIAALKTRNTPYETHKAFRVFFEECDLIKFAKHELAGEAMHNLVDIAEQLIIITQNEMTAALAGSSETNE